MGSYAELEKPEKLAAQMVVSDLDCAAVAREINARFGVPGRPQIVSRQFISRLKNGQVKGNRCTPALAECIAQVLGVDLSMLFIVREVSDQVGHSVPSRQKAPAA